MQNGLISGDQFPADYGFTLPNMFPSVGETLQNISAKKERDKMFDFEKSKFNDQLQQRDEAKRTQLLNQKTDALKYHTGLQVFDDWADKKAGDILEKYSTDPNITNLPPAQFAAQLNQDWLPIIQGYGAVKNKLTAENNSINQVTAQNKWIDKDQLTRDVYNQVASEYMQPDQNGDVTFKPTDRVDYNKDFAQELLASPDAYKYANDNAIGDFYKNITQPKEENRSYILNNPDNSTSVFEGKLSPFETENVVPNDKGFVNKAPTYSIVNEGRTDAIGNPINTLPVDTMNNYMLNTAGNKMAFQKLYNEYADKTGVDKNSQLEQQKFGYTLIKNLRNNQPSLHSYTRPPKISNTTNISVGDKQAQMTGNWANSVVSAAAKDDNATVNTLIDQMYSGNGERKLMGTYTKNENGQPMLYIRTQKRKVGEDDDADEQTVGIPANSPNAEALLLGQYQSIMGSNTKAESLPFKNNPVVPQKSNTQSKKKIEGF